jgi:hypothetical protein
MDFLEMSLQFLLFDSKHISQMITVSLRLDLQLLAHLGLNINLQLKCLLKK